MPGLQAAEQTMAQSTLTQFLGLLASGEYAEASSLFGGSYEELWYMNPQVQKNDLGTLWQNGCRLNGYQCLPLLCVINVQENGPGEFIFTVELEDESGHTFEMGACCGSSDDETVTHFEFRVLQKNSDYFVLDMPPLLP